MPYIILKFNIISKNVSTGASPLKNYRHTLKRNPYNKYYNFTIIDVVEITLSF